MEAPVEHRHARQMIFSDLAPAPIGPYSQAIGFARFVYTSGALGTDPGTGELVQGGIEAETRQALENLSQVLAAGQSGLDKVVKTTVFMADLSEFGAMNTVYAGFFASEPPARSTVQVAGLPRGARVEIEAIALREPPTEHDPI
jgi:2-iminobutanoate/2-iminopropanoate deaminase